MDIAGKRSSHRKRCELGLLDAVRRKEELQSYKDNPEQSMPVIFRGVKVSWPQKFRK